MDNDSDFQKYPVNPEISYDFTFEYISLKQIDEKFLLQNQVILKYISRNCLKFYMLLLHFN